MIISKRLVYWPRLVVKGGDEKSDKWFIDDRYIRHQTKPVAITTFPGSLALLHNYVIKWKKFRVTGHLGGEFTAHRRIPHTKASDAELWYFLRSAPDNGWINNGEAGDLRRHRVHYDVTEMLTDVCAPTFTPRNHAHGSHYILKQSRRTRVNDSQEC